MVLKKKFNEILSDTKFSEIIVGSTWALSARILTIGLGLAIYIIITRIYGAEMLGIVAMINSFLTLVTILTVLGTNTSILRLLPEHVVRYSQTSALKVYRKIQSLVIGVSLFTSILLLCCSAVVADKVFSKPHLSFYFAIAAVFVMFKSLMILNTQAVRGLKLVRAFALMLLMPHGFNLLLLIVLGVLVATVDVPVYAQLGSFALTGVLGWGIMESTFKQRIRPQDRVQSIPITEIVSISLPMLMTATMTLIISETGVIMLGMFRSEVDVGYYAIAVRVGTLTSFVLQAVNSIVAPKFSELFHSNQVEDLFYVAKKSAKLIFWTTTPVLLGFVIFGKDILGLVFGSEFALAYPALVILVLGEFVNSISGSTALFMNMTGNQKTFRNIMLLAAMINITLNLVLIPRLGIHGAAIAASSSLVVWNVTTLIYIKLRFGMTTGYFPFLASTMNQ